MTATTPSAQGKSATTSLILGCMFSGKTTELISRVGRFPPESVLAIKHEIDTRFGRGAIVTHGGKAIRAVAVAGAREILERAGGSVRVVAIDEGHFFEAELIGVIKGLNARGVSVVVASLEPDSWGRPFPINKSLRKSSDECVVKTAVCGRCGATADRTQRLTPIVGGNMVVDPSHYEPRCRVCWRPPMTS